MLTSVKRHICEKIWNGKKVKSKKVRGILIIQGFKEIEGCKISKNAKNLATEEDLKFLNYRLILNRDVPC